MRRSLVPALARVNGSRRVNANPQNPQVTKALPCSAISALTVVGSTDCRYSYLSASTGLTRVARRAGT